MTEPTTEPMTESTTPSPLSCLAQADLLQLLARLFSTPTPEVRAGLAAVGASDVGALVAAADLPEGEALAPALTALLDEARALSPEAWAQEHTRLFECAVPCPINETAYIRRDKGALLGDIAGFYRAFGLGPSEVPEKPDHLVAELEFSALLLVLLARALDEGLEEPAAVTRDALRAFASDHLGEWLPGFCLRLAQTAELSWYEGAAGLLGAVWDALCARHGLRPPAGRVLVTVEEVPGSPYECGMAEQDQT